MAGMKEYLWRLREGRGDDFEGIAAALGGEVEGRMVRCPSPGRPPDDRSCCVRIDPQRPNDFYIYYAEGPLGAAYAMVREQLKLVKPLNSAPDDHFKKIWAATVPAAGSVVEAYLRSRAITILPEVLRFHPALWHKGGRGHWPGMVAARTTPDGAMAAIHRTWLRRDGRGKASVDPQRMDLGPSRGNAIRLSPTAEELL